MTRHDATSCERTLKQKKINATVVQHRTIKYFCVMVVISFVIAYQNPKFMNRYNYFIMKYELNVLLYFFL